MDESLNRKSKQKFLFYSGFIISVIIFTSIKFFLSQMHNLWHYKSTILDKIHILSMFLSHIKQLEHKCRKSKWTKLLPPAIVDKHCILFGDNFDYWRLIPLIFQALNPYLRWCFTEWWKSAQGPNMKLCFSLTKNVSNHHRDCRYRKWAWNVLNIFQNVK